MVVGDDIGSEKRRAIAKHCMSFEIRAVACHKLGVGLQVATLLLRIICWTTWRYASEADVELSAKQRMEESVCECLS